MSKAKACPTSDSHHTLVMGKCLYFEETKMNYTEAKNNCADKMTSYGIGRLFEPKSYNMSEIVAAKANDILTADTWSWFWIGVNDIVQPDNFVYESNSLPISFTPNWAPIISYQPGNNIDNHKCIVVGFHPYLGVWANYECGSYEIFSVCE